MQTDPTPTTRINPAVTTSRRTSGQCHCAIEKSSRKKERGSAKTSTRKHIKYNGQNLANNFIKNISVKQMRFSLFRLTEEVQPYSDKSGLTGLITGLLATPKCTHLARFEPLTSCEETKDLTTRPFGGGLTLRQMITKKHHNRPSKILIRIRCCKYDLILDHFIYTL